MPLSPTATRELLGRLGHRPKRYLGQNFLVDGNIVRKSLQLADITEGDKVVEIGPGLGTLTSALLEAGAEVWAIEKDRTLYSHLLATLCPKYPDRLHLTEGDAVECPLAMLESSWDAPVHPKPIVPEVERRVPAALSFKVVANLPYAVSTPWMDAVLSGPLPARMVLMLQKEAANRYCASPGTKTFGAISIFLHAAYEVGAGHIVSGSCFYPRPDIDSRLLVLNRRPQPFVFSAPARAFFRVCFQQRRKQIGSIVGSQAPGLAEQFLGILRDAGLSEKTRAEEIPVEIWTRLSPIVPMNWHSPSNASRRF